MKHTLLLPVFFLLALTGFAQEKSSPKNKKAPKIPPGVRVIRDLEFAEHDGVSLKLDLYLPEKVDAKTALPVVIWIHGGGWKNGNKNNCKAAFLAAHDFAVASISYRLTDVAQWPAQINDCYAAVRWLRQNAAKHGLDGEKIGVWGGSAGAHLAALVGTRKFDGEEKVSSRVRAVCNWYGPSELLTMPPNTIGNGRTREQVEQSNGAKLLGATVMDVPELAKDASALDQVSADDPPFLIMHGSKDPGVPLEQSQKLHDKLKAAGVESELVVIEGAGHGGKEFQTDEVRNRIRDFFAKHLKNG